MKDLLWIIPVLPFLGALLNGFLLKGRIGKSAVAAIACGTVGLAAILGIVSIVSYLGSPEHAAGQGWDHDVYVWMPAGPLLTAADGVKDLTIPMGFLLDPLSCVMLFVVTFVVMVGLSLFISRSRLGRACRACAEDLKMANLLGINTNNIIALTFVIGATLAAVAAVLLGMQYGVINPHLGFLAGIKAFTAAVLGGIGSIPGAVLGGLVLGVAEAFGADIFGDQYKDVVAFSLLVLVLLFRPTGILGRPEVEKV